MAKRFPKLPKELKPEPSVISCGDQEIPVALADVVPKTFSKVVAHKRVTITTDIALQI
jgi:hypothetical protein